MDSILTIKRDNKPIDLFMVELQQMLHKTDVDTKYDQKYIMQGYDN